MNFASTGGNPGPKSRIRHRHFDPTPFHDSIQTPFHFSSLLLRYWLLVLAGAVLLVVCLPTAVYHAYRKKQREKLRDGVYSELGALDDEDFDMERGGNDCYGFGDERNIRNLGIVKQALDSEERLTKIIEATRKALADYPTQVDLDELLNIWLADRALGPEHKYSGIHLMIKEAANAFIESQESLFSLRFAGRSASSRNFHSASADLERICAEVNHQGRDASSAPNISQGGNVNHEHAEYIDSLQDAINRFSRTNSSTVVELAAFNTIKTMRVGPTSALCRTYRNLKLLRRCLLSGG